MRRRDFVALLGGTAVASLLPAVRGAPSSLPVIGYLSARPAGESRYLVEALEKGLLAGGIVISRDASFEFRWADNQYERLPDLAADLVKRQVALIVASGGVQAILAARAATASIPVVFVTGDDPVRLGLVASMNRPGGNLTGVSALTQSLEAKRLDILHQLLPNTTRIAMLVSRNNPSAELQLKEASDAARVLGRQLDVLSASSDAEIDGAFSALAEHGDGALILSADPFINSHRAQIVSLAQHHKVPAFFYTREQAMAGGLMSYGASFPEAFAQAGGYAARILKGEKAGDLPILQSSKFEFIINLKTARALGLDIPPRLLALADEVIE